MKTCTNCGRQFEGKFCPACGTLAQDDSTCPACGVRLSGSPSFCPNCGHSISAPNQPASTPVNDNNQTSENPTDSTNTNSQVHYAPGVGTSNYSRSYTPGTGYSQYNGEPTQPVKQTNGFAIAGFILSFFGGLLGLILSIVGIVKAKDYGGSGKGLAIAGIIISVIAMIFWFYIGSMLPDEYYGMASLPAILV